MALENDLINFNHIDLKILVQFTRITLAKLLLHAGQPYHQVMKINGHKKLTTLQKYIKSEADVDGMLAVGNGLVDS